VIALVGGVFLLFYYFCRFVPKAKKHTAQVVSIFFVMVAALMRFIYAAFTLSLGPRVIAVYFFQNPNATQMVLRLTLQMYYPLTLAALAIQILIWLEFVVAVKSVKLAVAWWFPLIKWVLIPLMIVFFILELISQILLFHNFTSSTIFLVYFIVLCLYVCVLLIVAAVFSIRFFIITKRNNTVDSKMSARNKQSRNNLTIMILFSCGFVLVGLILGILRIQLNVEGDANNYWPYIFTLRLVEQGLLLSLLITALAMMRNRVAYTAGKAGEAEDRLEKVKTVKFLIGYFENLCF
jgi:hypothetical protein